MTPHRTRALVAITVLLLPVFLRADAVPIDIVDRGANRIMIDGLLGDWRRFTELVAVDDPAQIVSGRAAWHGPDDASFGYAFARDPQLLFIAAEVHDDVIVRSREHRANDDALVVSLGAPGTANHPVGYDIVIYPGEPGSFAGAVRFRGARSGEVAGAQVVEAPMRGASGYTIEVGIPWRAIPEVLAGIASARARVAYQDDDNAAHSTVDTVLASGPGDGQHVATIPPIVGSNANGTSDLIDDFRRSHGFEVDASLLDRSANIAGDAALERVVVYPGYIAVAGPGIAGGTHYAFVQFPLGHREDVLEPSLRDVTGDGRLDVLLRLRVAAPNGLQREILYVYGAPNGGDQLTQIFAIELARTVGTNRLANRATYEHSDIRVSLDGVTGFTQASYPRVVENGVVPPLTPWSENRAAIYHWSDTNQRFDIANSEPNPTATHSGNETLASGAPPSPAMNAVPGGDSVLAAFRRQNGIAADAAASFSATANVAGDAATETIQIFGRMLVVFGAHFMNGRSFYSLELPANADADVLSLSTGDVTDDGRAEAIVHVRREATAQVRGRALDATKEYLLVYSLDDAHRGRVFAAEVSRRVGSDAIANVVRPVPAGRNAQIVIDAGTVSGGWNAETYPFHDLPQQGFAPLLLPWVEPRHVVYHWDGSGLIASHP